MSIKILKQKNINHVLVFFGFFRIIFAAGLSTLVIGTKGNHKSRTSCGYLHHNYLSIGGILCFVHALLSVAYYVAASQNLA